MTVVSFPLPYPPSANKLWRFVPGQPTPLKSREYRAWLAQADAAIPMAARGMIRGAHEVLIQADRPDRRARDIDNLTKPIMDAIKETATSYLKGVIRDDSDTLRITTEWRSPDPVGEPVVTVTVTARAA